MIYVAEKDQARQFELLALIASQREYNLVAWLYRESPAPRLLGAAVMENASRFLPVSSYPDGIEPRRTAPIRASGHTLAGLRDHAAEIKRHCDSLALYVPSEPEWTACTIGHEGMCLVRDDEVIDMLAARGFNVSLAAPAWW